MKKTLHGRRHLRARVPVMRAARERRQYKRYMQDIKLLTELRYMQDIKLLTEFWKRFPKNFVRVVEQIDTAFVKTVEAVAAMIDSIDWLAVSYAISNGIPAALLEIQKQNSGGDHGLSEIKDTV